MLHGAKAAAAIPEEPKLNTCKKGVRGTGILKRGIAGQGIRTMPAARQSLLKQLGTQL
jgi:hypothetical protein